VDVVVVDVLAKYGMLLSRSWGAKIGGSVQLDITYATIPIFVDNLLDCTEKIDWSIL
jgi:hypothetical protein